MRFVAENGGHHEIQFGCCGFFGVVERGGDENDVDHELKEEEEDGGSEPAVNDNNLRDFHDWEDDDDVAKR